MSQNLACWVVLPYYVFVATLSGTLGGDRRFFLKTDRITGPGKSRGNPEDQKKGNTAPKRPLDNVKTNGKNHLPSVLPGKGRISPSGGVWVFMQWVRDTCEVTDKFRARWRVSCEGISLRARNHCLCTSTGIFLTVRYNANSALRND